RLVVVGRVLVVGEREPDGPCADISAGERVLRAARLRRLTRRAEPGLRVTLPGREGRVGVARKQGDDRDVGALLRDRSPQREDRVVEVRRENRDTVGEPFAVTK